jgi:hypothetical protein
MNNTYIQFRTDNKGNLVTVTEFNTKITYVNMVNFKIGRLEFSFERMLVLRTIKAHTKFRAYTALKTALRGLGVHVDMAV